jgi:pimeloyl-ACP methyl ester carboxylesterase
MKQVRALSRHDASRQLDKLAGIPTFVLNAEHDPIALPQYGRMLANAIPGARLMILPAASHA